MKRFRFVHAADIHLDSPFRGLHRADPALGKVLSRSTFDSFERIIALCIEREADALLVAGDVYDGADRSLRAQLAFQAGLERLSERGIRAFIAHGNHDPLDGWQAELRLPEGCHRFGETPETVPLDPARPEWVALHGMSYPRRVVTENVAARFRAIGAAINVAVLHATVGTQEGHDPYAPCVVADLERSGMDYWALGHVHERQVIRAAEPAIVYPGNSQGRHIREPGARGVYVVDLESRTAPKLEFVATDVVRWARVEVRIDAMESEQDLIDGCMAASREPAAGSDGRYLLAVLRLTGSGLLRASLRREGFLDELREHLDLQLQAAGRRVTIAAIEDGTRTEHPADEPDGLTFRAELLRQGYAGNSSVGDDEWRQSELEELLDDRRVRRYLDGRDRDDDLLERATDRALEALEAGR